MLQTRFHAAVATVAFALGMVAFNPVVQAAPQLNSLDELPSFSTIVERVGPAVVNISTQGTVSASSPFPGVDPNDPFFDFFRRFDPHFGMPRGERYTRSQGSGFIVSTDGIVLTNAHVVENASEVIVKLTDKREFKAEVIGVDKPTDVAVLRIHGKDLPHVSIGNPDKVRVGDWVVAIGSPFGFESTVTAGIVSAKSRSLPNDGYVPFLQTDVAINPGNSGGPLLNLDGEVVGINSQIYSRSGGFQGLSFAIPIDVADNIKGQLLKHGKVTRGRIGVTIQDLNQALADSFGLESAHGALISTVESGSPAEKADLKPGDVILSLNGEPVTNSSDLPPRIAAISPGTQAQLQVWRDKKTKAVNVTIGEHGDASVVADADGKSTQGRLGLTARALTEAERTQADLSKGGLLVMEVAGAASRAGIRRGDLILSVNGQSVETVEQLRKLTEKAGKSIALLIQRQDARIFIPVELG